MPQAGFLKFKDLMRSPTGEVIFGGETMRFGIRMLLG